MVKKDVPSKAVRMRNTKKAGRLGDRAVPTEQPRNRKAVVRHIW
jgi:hypothetical protein